MADTSGLMEGFLRYAEKHVDLRKLYIRCLDSDNIADDEWFILYKYLFPGLTALTLVEAEKEADRLEKDSPGVKFTIHPVTEEHYVCLQLQSTSGNIQFHFDSAQFQQMHDATGFIPAIISIQSSPDVNRFLGLSDAPPVAAAAPPLH